MGSEACPPPQDNVLDLADVEICEKCRNALMAKFMKMVNEVAIDQPFSQEDFDRNKHERK